MHSTPALVSLFAALLFAAGAATLWNLHRLLARRRQRQRDMRAAAAQAAVLQVLFEHSDDAVVLCDAQGRIAGVNPAAVRLLELPGEGAMGSAVTEWLVPGAPAAAARGGTAALPLVVGEHELRRVRTGSSIRARVAIHTVQAAGGQRIVVVIRDLTDQRRVERALNQLAHYDALTGLPNRMQFRERLARAMERAQRGGRSMALFFLDLDRFKVVNDSLGHEAGDSLLKHVAHVLTSCLRGGDSVLLGPRLDGATLSRLGGDEFTVILENVGGAEEAAVVAQRLLDALAAPITIGGQEVHVSASIGISLYPAEDVDLDGMIRRTDMAMYRSKALGRSTFSFFSDDLNAAVGARLALEASLRQALERDEFQLHFQPKASLQDRRITGVEALLRWHCPGRGMVPPDRFIGVLEETGLIVHAGAWVIREACRQLAAWDAQGLPPISVAVNLSARQLRHPFLVALVRDTLSETGIEPERLELELTESMLMEDTDGNRAVLSAFHRLGVRLAIDDFGTGHSSLSYLRRLEVDTLKIDRSFVIQLPDDAEDAAIAKAIVAMGMSLGMTVVAEGVETDAQADFLRHAGCHHMQGWLLSRALPPAQLAGWLRAQHRDYLLRTQPGRYQAADAVELPNIQIPDVPRTRADAAT